MNVFKVIPLIILAVLLTTLSFTTPPGLLYSNTQEPAGSGTTKSEAKSSSGSSFSILGLMAFGDTSVDAIAKKENILTIHHIDKSTFSLFFLFSEETYTVYGW